MRLLRFGGCSFIKNIYGLWSLDWGSHSRSPGGKPGIRDAFTLGINQSVGTFGTCQPDVLPGKDPKNAPPGGRRPEEWFDTSAVVAPKRGTPGTLGVQINNYPGQRSVDFSLFKDVPFTERYKLQFRAEAFNLANTPQGGKSNGGLDVTQGDPLFGQITATQSNTQRHVQFALRFMF